MSEVIETQFDSDQFLKLLTEALRAGPGSPQWHEAVNQLKNSTLADADEYRMIINAREHLESGRDYRSIRAGPGFTKKVMSAIDEEAAAAGQAPATSSAGTVALVAGICIIAVIVIVAVIWYRGSPPQPSPTDLANIVFAQTTISTDFTQTQTIPPEWRSLGLPPVISSRSRGLAGPHVKPAPGDDKDHRGGGIYSASGMPATQTFAFEAAVRQYKVSENVVQIFITDTPDFDQNPKASSPRELVCYLLNGTINIAKPDGSIQGSGSKAKDLNHIRIKLDKQFVVIENDGQTLYSGKHDLSPEKARYAGVRFLVKPSEKPLEDVTVHSVRVLKP
jgi:hypothetical protein